MSEVLVAAVEVYVRDLQLSVDVFQPDGEAP